MPQSFIVRRTFVVFLLFVVVVGVGLALLLPRGGAPIATRETVVTSALDQTGADFKLPSAAEVAAQNSDDAKAEADRSTSVVDASSNDLMVSAESHPLDPALEIARERLADMQENLIDYEATVTSRERIGNKLREPQTMLARIRERKVEHGRITTPLSVYLRFTEPGSLKGQEALWVESQNNNKLLGHQGGTLGRFTPAIWLDPKGPIAMRGSRYPITEIGLTNLVAKLIEKGERDRKYEEVEVCFDDKAKVAGRPATLIEVKHPTPRPYFDFHLARIYIDKELNLPVRYAAYSWPRAGSSEPVLLEEYTYTNIKLNVGFTDKDFDQYNKSYGFH